jgi:hypothetical protein
MARNQISRSSGPLVKVSPGLLLVILLVLLASATLLLVFARTREQVLGSFVLFALLVAVVTFGFLGASGLVKTRQRQIGGSAAGLIVVLGMLLPFARDPTVDIRGFIYVDGLPPKEVTVYLLEADLRENRSVLEERDQGQFEFKDVRSLGKEVVLKVQLPFFERIFRVPASQRNQIRIDIPAKDIAPQGGPAAHEDPQQLQSCIDAQDQDVRTVYLFDLQAAGVEAARLNEFLNVLAYRLDHGIRNHLISQGLLDPKLWSVQRCGQVSVSLESQAASLGKRLNAAGVLWGYAERRSPQLQSLIHFTSVARPPFSVIGGLDSRDDLRDLADFDRPLDTMYFAFSSFLLGQEHMSSGRPVMARRCLLHALELSPAATPLRSRIEEDLRRLDPANPAGELAPIGAGA